MIPLTWRATLPSDRDAIRALIAECDAHDGTAERADLWVQARILLDQGDGRGYRVICGNEEGRIVAAGSVMHTEDARVQLTAFVSPVLRDELEAPLLGDLVERAIAQSPQDAVLRFDRVLAPETESLPASTMSAYTGLGFTRQYIELELVRPLSTPLPDTNAIPGVSIEGWRARHESSLRDAYNDAFSTRGFGGYSEEEWARETFSLQEDFAPSCSFVAIASGAIVGFAMCLRERDEGWIDSVGVRPAWRGRGIADALLLSAMQAMCDDGITSAALRVNVDNAQANAVYRRLGFEVRRKHEVWSRTWSGGGA